MTVQPTNTKKMLVVRSTLCLFVCVLVLSTLQLTESRVSRRATISSYYKPTTSISSRPIKSTLISKPVITVNSKPINKRQTTIKVQPISVSKPVVNVKPITPVKPLPVSPVLTYPLIQPLPSISLAPIVSTNIGLATVIKSNPAPASKPLTSTVILPSYSPPVANYILAPLPSTQSKPYVAPPPVAPTKPSNIVRCGTVLRSTTDKCKKSQAGREFRGDISRTVTGEYCDSWSSALSRRPGLYADKNFPDSSIYYAYNMCRNPDPQFNVGPWCYTRNVQLSWQLCDIPFCAGFSAGSQNTSTGPPSDPYNVCKSKVCPYGSRCEYVGKLSPTDAQCVCPSQTCPSTISPICGTNGVTYDNECHLMKAQCNSTLNISIRHKGRCYEMCKTEVSGSSYMGNVTQTRGGRSCQRWSAQYPNTHGFSSANQYPDLNVAEVENRCRNPDPTNKKSGPWCYTTLSNDWDYCDVPSCLGCQKLDIVLAVHQSSLVSLQTWSDLIQEFTNFLSAFKIGQDNVRVGVLTYGTTASVRFNLNELNSKEEVIKEMQKITYSQQRNNVPSALLTAQQMFKLENGDRPDVQNVLVLYTAAERDYYDALLISQYTKQLQDSGVQMYAVGVGTSVYSYGLSTLASYSSDNRKKLSYHTTDYKKLYTVLNDVATDMCRNSPDNDMECTRTAGGWDYVGSVSKTKSGLACRSWASESLDERHRYTGAMFPDGTLAAAGTKCRNPDPDFTVGPWCFTNNKIVPWEVCDIKTCKDKVKPQIVKSQTLIGNGLISLVSIGLPSGGSQLFDPCQGKLCPYGSRCERLMAEGPTSTHCICPTQACPVGSAQPICGTDGVTYENECQLMKAQCANVAKSPSDRIQVLHKGKCRCDKADIVFVLDGSGSISNTVWTRILQFTKDIVATLNVGQSNIRVAALEFATQAKIKFHLNTLRTKQDVLAGIDGVRKSNGGTNTADAFYISRTEMFTEKHGDRKDVPNIIILVTDGQSTINAQRTVQYAEDAKKAGITVIAVGVQYQTSYYTNELNQVASLVNGVKQVYHINNVYSMGNLHKTISTAVCVQASDPCLDRKCLYGAMCKTDLDQVSGTRCECPTLILSSVPQYVCGDDNVTYTSEQHLIGARCEKQQMISMKHRGACPDPCTKMVCLHGAECKVAGGAASCVCPKVTCPTLTNQVCGSDGVTYSTECDLRREACQNKRDVTVKNQGPCVKAPATVKAQPAENKSKRTEYFCKSTTAGTEFRGNITKTLTGKNCQAWGSQVPNQHPYTVPTLYPEGNVAESGNQCRNPDPQGRKAGPWCFTSVGPTSKGWEYCDVPACSGCELVDIVFMLDSSVSISYQFWPRALGFAKDLIKNFNFGDQAARFGVVTYGYQSSIEFHLNEYNSKEAVLAAVDKIVYKAESTNTSGAIWTMKEKMFRAGKGDRRDAPNIGILVTDGISNMDEEYTIPYATDAKRAGITLFAVGVGSFIDDSELRGVASKVKDKEEVYYVSDYDSLLNIRDEISRAICTGASATSV